MIPLIRYPKCGGGHWLGNLVWHLQTANWDLPANGVIFDGLPQGAIKLNHWFETQPDGTPNFREVNYQNNQLFSTDCKFNMYLNFCKKSRYARYQVHQLPIAEHVLDLSDTARFVMTNNYYDQYYCHNIELDYRWIFQDPTRFADWVCEFLDTNQIAYHDNRDYMLTSMVNYGKTCIDPSNIIGNLDSPIWLGWLHAVSLINNIGIDGIIAEQTSAKSIAALLEPTYTQATTLAEQYSFNWTYEHTTR